MTVTAKRLLSMLVLASLWLVLRSARLIAVPTPAPAPRIAVDCAQASPKFVVRSSVDRKIYAIDVCAVADSAEGEDFRQEMK